MYSGCVTVWSYNWHKDAMLRSQCTSLVCSIVHGNIKHKRTARIPSTSMVPERARSPQYVGMYVHTVCRIEWFTNTRTLSYVCAIEIELRPANELSKRRASQQAASPYISRHHELNNQSTSSYFLSLVSEMLYCFRPVMFKDDSDVYEAAHGLCNVS